MAIWRGTVLTLADIGGALNFWNFSARSKRWK
jgi:hypothetical protein